MGTPVKSFVEMLGEALRDLAVLSVLFVPLDFIAAGRPFGWGSVAVTGLCSSLLFLFGVILEKIRP
jgi:hypothetical protein